MNPARVSNVLAALGFCVWASACSNRPDNAAEQVAATRRVSPSTRVLDTVGRSWRTLWTYDGHAAGSMLLFPVALVADERSVFVLDAAMQRAQRFDARTGRLMWMFPDSASGARLDQAVALAVGPLGDLAILEHGSRSIRIVGPDGKENATVKLPTRSEPIALCVTPDGMAVGIQGLDDDPVLYLSTAGEVVGRASLPWEHNRGVAILRQFRLAGGRQGTGCALVHNLALGVTWVRPGGDLSLHEYVERMALPRATVTVDSTKPGQRRRTESILDKQDAAIDAAVDRAELVIAFGGRTKLAGRIIDVYSYPEMAYKRSVVFPSRITSMSRVDGTYYVIAQMKGAPVLLAARVTPE